MKRVHASLDAVPKVALAPRFEISRIVNGLWQVADLERKGGLGLDLNAALADLKAAHAAGFTSFDMADHYGSAEELLGHLPDFQAFTKWVPKPGPEQATTDAVDRAVCRSLERLKRRRIDLLQFHTWDYLDGPGTWIHQLRLLQAHEGVEHLGLTNFDTSHLQLALASGIQIVSNQICFSLLDRRALGDMSSLCRSSGVKILAFGVLAGGLLTDKFLGRGPPTNDELAASWSLAKYYRFVTCFGGWELLQELLAVLRSIANRHIVGNEDGSEAPVSIANVATRWVLECKEVAAVIVGARLGHSEHVADNKRIFKFSLSILDKEDISGVLSKSTPIPGDCGDEYRRPPFLTASGDLSHHLSEVPNAFKAVMLPGHTAAVPRLLVEAEADAGEMLSSCRGVRVGSKVSISGTMPTKNWPPVRLGDVVGGQDPEAQTTFVLDVIEATLKALGATLGDVVHTRIYVRSMEHRHKIGQAYRRRLPGLHRPASTLVQAVLNSDAYLVCIDAEAEVISKTANVCTA